MRRFIFNENINDIDRHAYDVAIVGSGIAGLYAALNADKRLSIVILNKGGMQVSNSWYAQGGIAAAMEKDDSADSHFRDTMEAGAYACDEEALRVLVHEGPREIETLISMGVPFDTDENGRLHATREGAHSHDRIVHCGGDATGLGVTKRLAERVAAAPNITLREGVCLTDIVQDDSGRTAGLLVLENGRSQYYAAPHVVVCAGGVGRVFRNSTNARSSTGDGIAAAARAGAALKDMEFVQFHPTALIHPDETGRFFLISEALRGEGAVLRNRHWERFMQGVHPLADLAPRDIVTRAIIREMSQYDIPHVYLDITERPRSFLAARFPTIYEGCMSRGIDIARDWIPVIPVQHYFMGGVAVDRNAQTNVPGLYACGESSCTGVHGANRLASNSLLECLVFSRRCMDVINGKQAVKAGRPDMTGQQHKNGVVDDLDTMRTEIRNQMTRKGGILRNAAGMTEALDRIQEMAAELDDGLLSGKKAIETYNMAMIAREILSAALKRSKSLGAHYRDDEEEGEDNA